MSAYKNILRPLLFNLESENAHETACDLLTLLHRMPTVCNIMKNLNQIQADQPVELFGITFPNRIGLAAGFDKNGKFPRASAAFGFGHVEVGTVTPQAQPGNPKPRLFRIPEEGALINRMGFNNLGSKYMYTSIHKNFPKSNRSIPLGINIGKGKATPIENAIQDYLTCFDVLADEADYFTINVSSPNTKNLRHLQSNEALNTLLGELKKRNTDYAKAKQQNPIPMVLKIAPDLTYNELDLIIENIISHEYDGIIATNTTIQRPINTKINESGGYSGGELIHKLSMKTLHHIVKITDGKLPIIATGGINNASKAKEKIDAGATLIQIYSGWVFEGPLLPKKIAKELKNLG